MDRVMVFIDGSNLYHILKSIYGESKELNAFDFNKFIQIILKNRKLIRTYYYNAILDQKKDHKKYSKQQKFFEKLKLIPDFQVVLCRMQKDFVDGKTSYSVKEDDIYIATDMIKLAYANAYDVAILVSTDGDFVPAVKAVKETGKKVENVGFEKKFSWHLKQTCDRFLILSKRDLDRCF